MTAYLTQLVRGCHRSANDPENSLNASGIPESLFGDKKNLKFEEKS